MVIEPIIITIMIHFFLLVWMMRGCKVHHVTIAFNNKEKVNAFSFLNRSHSRYRYCDDQIVSLKSQSMVKNKSSDKTALSLSLYITLSLYLYASKQYIAMRNEISSFHFQIFSISFNCTDRCAMKA